MRDAVHRGFPRGGVLGTNLAQKARVRLAEQEHGCVARVFVARDGPEVDLRPPPAGKSHFRRRNGQAAFAQVVAGADQAGVDGVVQCGEGCLRGRGIDVRHLAPAGALTRA